ncbi:multidrug resistance efflux transporter family protein [Hymenobacter wooponensis]|uniref:Multidrug resistance efflux transporter family protein n=1 Tax=Hymenobacter wooponensis TaxID=1525360 RepID=A0A4Z0MUA5_9BACT|nr:multidrug resistance efflux transporter family protein [Hymenobacter wooponensis]TGD83214.1 multidrug resistance efflux transporter family protein [Hymenobacter wooponensis]
MTVSTASPPSPTAWRAIVLGTLGACLFSSTFLLNRLMATSGGSWVWTAVLRYCYMAVLLTGWLLVRGQWPAFWRFWRSTWPTWVLWGTIGVGLFYSLVAVAAQFSPAWLVAGSFQLVLLSGLLITPFVYHDHRAPLNFRALRLASLVVVGIVLMQADNLRQGFSAGALLGFGLTVLSTFLYPLANRKILVFLETQPVRLNAGQMVLGLTLGSLPFWAVLSGIGLATGPGPTPEQWRYTFIIALLAGVLATSLFYYALALVGNNAPLLGAVEATQSVELLATVALEVTLLGAPLPSPISWLGMALVVLGIGLYARLR